MIHVSVQASRNARRQPKTHITCPQCNAVDFFHNFVARTCNDCGFPWGNIKALMDDVRVRKYYYKEGEID